MLRFIIFAVMAAGMACALPAHIRDHNKQGTYTKAPAPAQLSDLLGDLSLSQTPGYLSSFASELLAGAMGPGPQVFTKFRGHTLLPKAMTAPFPMGHGPVVSVAPRPDVGPAVTLARRHVTWETATATDFTTNTVDVTKTIEVTATPTSSSTSTTTSTSTSTVDVTATVEVTVTPSSSSTSTSTSNVGVTHTVDVTETIEVTVTPSSTVDVTKTAKVTRTVTPTEVPSSSTSSPSPLSANPFPSADPFAPRPTPAPEPTSATTTTTVFVTTQTPEVIPNPEIYVPPNWTPHHIPICQGQYPDADCCPGHHPNYDCPVHTLPGKRAVLDPATATSSHVAPATNLPVVDGGDEFPRIPFYVPVPLSVESAWSSFKAEHTAQPDINAAAHLVNPKLGYPGKYPPAPTGPAVPETLPSYPPTVKQRWLDGVDECVKNPLALYCIAQPPKAGHAIRGAAPTDVPTAEERDVAGPRPGGKLDPHYFTTLTLPIDLPPPRRTGLPLVKGREVAAPRLGKPIGPGSYLAPHAAPPAGRHPHGKPDDPRFDDSSRAHTTDLPALLAGLPTRPDAGSHPHRKPDDPRFDDSSRAHTTDLPALLTGLPARPDAGSHPHRKPGYPHLADSFPAYNTGLPPFLTSLPPPRPTGPPPPVLAKKATAAKCESEDPANCEA